MPLRKGKFVIQFMQVDIGLLCPWSINVVYCPFCIMCSLEMFTETWISSSIG